MLICPNGCGNSACGWDWAIGHDSECKKHFIGLAEWIPKALLNENVR